MGNSRKYDLEDRLIGYAVAISDFVDQLPKNRLGNYLADQLLRSGVSPSLNYGEVQAAESKKDFVHKMKLCLKELRESRVSLKILHKKSLLLDDTLLNETEELISIFVKSIKTAMNNVKQNHNS